MGCNINLEYNCAIFDLDGVITKTAKVHASAWEKMFNDYLKLRESRDKEPFKPFTSEDYLSYVDGKPRYEGVKSFLESRGIIIEFGDPSDPVENETVCGLGNRKNIKFRDVLNTNGVEEYHPAVKLIRSLREHSVHVGVASSSKNCQFILHSAEIEDLFETRVDGVVSAKLGLNGKPSGDIFVRACENLGCKPDKSIVFEDAVAGVQAGVDGGFGLIVGVARQNNELELKENGADKVVASFEHINLSILNDWFIEKNLCK